MWHRDFLGSSSAIGGVYLERSLSAWDQWHWFAMNFTWEVPVGRQRLLGSGLNSEIITFQSALPHAQQRPNLLTGPRIPDSAVEKYDCFFNTAAFPQPKPYTFGTAPRVLSTLRGPFAKSADVFLFKKFALTGDGRVYLQVSVTTYNVTNRGTFGDPDMMFGNGSFGNITSQAIGARSATLATELYF